MTLPLLTGLASALLSVLFIFTGASFAASTDAPWPARVSGWVMLLVGAANALAVAHALLTAFG